jgi:hypothetical protein
MGGCTMSRQKPTAGSAHDTDAGNQAITTPDDTSDEKTGGKAPPHPKSELEAGCSHTVLREQTRGPSDIVRSLGLCNPCIWGHIWGQVLYCACLAGPAEGDGVNWAIGRLEPFLPSPNSVPSAGTVPERGVAPVLGDLVSPCPHAGMALH